MNKKTLLWLIAVILGAIGLGESNFIANFLSWGRQEHNWIDVQFDFKWFTEDIHIVWQVSLINCIIIFWSMMWISWLFFVISGVLSIKRKRRKKK